MQIRIKRETLTSELNNKNVLFLYLVKFSCLFSILSSSSHFIIPIIKHTGAPNKSEIYDSLWTNRETQLLNLIFNSRVVKNSFHDGSLALISD